MMTHRQHPMTAMDYSTIQDHADHHIPDRDHSAHEQ